MNGLLSRFHPIRAVTTVDGYELQFATNFLGHFALTGLLLDLLRLNKAARVVNLGSVGAKLPSAKIDLENLQLEDQYSGMRAYARSKMAVLLFTREMARRSEAARWGILSVAAHPGSTHTNLQVTGPRFGRDNNKRPLNATTIIMRLPGMAQDVSRGVLPILVAATAAGVQSGQYFGPSRHFEMVGQPTLVLMPKLAEDRSTARRLWESAEQLTGVKWPIVPAS